MHLGGFSLTKKRIWELDVLRGICILGMVVFHLIYDLTYLYAIVDWQLPPFLDLIQPLGGLVFLMLSGLCVTLGSRTLRRGLIVFGSGMLCTLVTWVMYRMDLLYYSDVIRFGVLHCLGACMLLWPLLKKLPVWVPALLAAVLLPLGYWLDAHVTLMEIRWLFPLGLTHFTFASGDYYPLLPYMGWFLLGTVLGRTLYRKKETLLPAVNEKNAVIRFFSFCGRQSLLIYLLHQPLLTGLMELLVLLTNS